MSSRSPHTEHHGDGQMDLHRRPHPHPLPEATKSADAEAAHTAPPPRATPTLFLMVGSALLYGGVSVAMNFVNKFTMRVFPLTNLIVALQMACTWAILTSQRDMGYVSFPPFNWQKAKQLSGITLLYTLNTVFSLVGLKTLNVPMYNVLKRMTPVLILLLKAWYRKRWPPGQISASVALVVGGFIIAGIGDLTFDLWGYVYALLSCTCQAVYLLIVEFQGSDYGVDSTEMLYYNAVTSFPLLVTIAWGTGEVAALPHTYVKGVELSGSPFLLWGNVLACALMGMLLNYAQFLCTTVNTALATTIVGVAKGIIAVILGFFLLGGVQFSPLNVTGITINTIGVVLYTYIKYRDSQAARERAGS